MGRLSSEQVSRFENRGFLAAAAPEKPFNRGDASAPICA